MPSPDRLVRRSVWLLRELGFGPTEAAELVADIARKAQLRAALTQCGDISWLLQVEQAAIAFAKSSRLPRETKRMVSHGRDQH